MEREKNHYTLLKEGRKREPANFNGKFVVLSEQQIEENGVITSRIVPTVVDTAKQNSEYKCSDFKLENMIATGTINTLEESRLIQNNVINDELQLQKLTEKFDAYVAKEN